MALTIKPKDGCRWDLLSLGEVMLRFDPGDKRIWTTRSFDVYEGGGEYNVARGMKRCFGKETAVVTAFVDNPVGRLVEDLIFQGGVDSSLIRWVADDGVGRSARNGLNFTERGFGVRAAVGCSDRGHTAIANSQPGDFDWDYIFTKNGSRWLHTGGIFAALSSSSALVAKAAVDTARAAKTIVSYDLNYRDSLWKGIGGKTKAQEINRELVSTVDVLFGNEEDFSAALGVPIEGVGEDFAQLPISSYKALLHKVAELYPNLKLIATTLRTAHTATKNDWGAIALYEGKIVYVEQRELEIMDRVGGGDSFASGLIYGVLAGKGSEWAVQCGVAHGALAMTTPGDTSMATLSEVESVMRGASARITR